jgi:hypothetical protein
MKILTTKTEKIEIERDIKLPFYCKSEYHSYKIESETKAIQVFTPTYTGPSISSVLPGTAFTQEWDEITESEFETILQETLAKILN